MLHTLNERASCLCRPCYFGGNQSAFSSPVRNNFRINLPHFVSFLYSMPPAFRRVDCKTHHSASLYGLRNRPTIPVVARFAAPCNAASKPTHLARRRGGESTARREEARPWRGRRWPQGVRWLLGSLNGQGDVPSLYSLSTHSLPSSELLEPGGSLPRARRSRAT